MAKLLDHATELPVDERGAALAQAKICVWDVLRFVEREGSLDKNMRSGTEQPNLVHTLYHDGLRCIAFNGQAAQQFFNRHCLAEFERFFVNSVPPKRVLLPSTSPAHAVLDKHQKHTIWAQKLALGEL